MRSDYNGLDAILTLDVKVTYKCNLACMMCGQRSTLSDTKNELLRHNYQNAMLSVEDLEYVFNTPGLRPSHTDLYGGEPLLNAEIFEMIHIVKKNKCFCSLITNGLLLVDNIKNIINSGLDMLILSIDGPSSIHDQIRGREGTLNVLHEVIRELNSFKKSKLKPLIFVNFTITEKNFFFIEETVKDLINLGVNHIEISMPKYIDEKICTEYERLMKNEFNVLPVWHKGFLRMDYEMIDCDLLANELSRVKANYPTVRTPSIDSNKYFSGIDRRLSRSPGIPCQLPWNCLTILPNCDVAVCPDFPDYIIGNFHQQSIDEIWNGEKMNNFREYLMKNEVIPLCSRCHCGGLLA